MIKANDHSDVIDAVNGCRGVMDKYVDKAGAEYRCRLCARSVATADWDWSNMERRIFLRYLHHFGVNGVSRVEFARTLDLNTLDLNTNELERELGELLADNEIEILPNGNLRLASCASKKVWRYTSFGGCSGQNLGLY